MTFECSQGRRHHLVDEENGAGGFFHRRDKCPEDLDAILVGAIPEDVFDEIHDSYVVIESAGLQFQPVNLSLNGQ